VLVLVLVLLHGCFRQGQETVDYSKTARFPDDQGRVTGIDFSTIQLEGRRSYDISDDVQSFVTYSGKVTPLLSWKDKFVHLGLDKDRKVIWVAGIGVIDRSAGPPSVYYTNATFVRTAPKRRAVFKDGTVLVVPEEVQLPKKDSKVTARIDAEKHVVIAFTVT
jgi:hypothetical protein